MIPVIEGQLAGQTICLRPSFAALYKAEAEIGPLVTLARRAVDRGIALRDVAVLLWACQCGPVVGTPPAAPLSLDDMGELVLVAGLAQATPLFQKIMEQVLVGSAQEDSLPGKPIPEHQKRT